MKSPDEIAAQILIDAPLAIKETEVLSIEIVKAIQAERARADKLVEALDEISLPLLGPPHPSLELEEQVGILTELILCMRVEAKNALKEYRGEK